MSRAGRGLQQILAVELDGLVHARNVQTLNQAINHPSCALQGPRAHVNFQSVGKHIRQCIYIDCKGDVKSPRGCNHYALLNCDGGEY